MKVTRTLLQRKSLNWDWLTDSEVSSIIIMTANKHGNMQVCVVLEKELRVLLLILRQQQEAVCYTECSLTIGSLKAQAHSDTHPPNGAAPYGPSIQTHESMRAILSKPPKQISLEMRYPLVTFSSLWWMSSSRQSHTAWLLLKQGFLDIAHGLPGSFPEHRKLGNMTVTVRKTVPSPEAVQILYQRMRYEYEFYHYVREQFHLLKRKLGLKSRVSGPPVRPQFFIPTPLETEEPIDDEEQDDEKWLEDIYKR